MTYNVFGGTLSLTQSINQFASLWLLVFYVFSEFGQQYQCSVSPKKTQL